MAIFYQIQLFFLYQSIFKNQQIYFCDSLQSILLLFHWRKYNFCNYWVAKLSICLVVKKFQSSLWWRLVEAFASKLFGVALINIAFIIRGLEMKRVSESYMDAYTHLKGTVKKSQNIPSACSLCFRQICLSSYLAVIIKENPASILLTALWHPPLFAEQLPP